jgi:acetyltransferase-like isoleucine patch superfamily enzyme
VILRAIEFPRCWSDVTLEKGAFLDRSVVLLCSGAPKRDKLLIRSGTYVNRFTMFDAHHHLEIGRDCMIGPHCYLTDSDHGTDPKTAIKDQPMTSTPVVIEDEVWLGAHVVVLRGTRIGRGAVIGAGSVVTCDIPAGSTALGVPARVVASR